jgi:hypothetical protein
MIVVKYFTTIMPGDTLVTIPLPPIPAKALLHMPLCSDHPDQAPAWDAYLNGALVASGFTSHATAQTELDLVAWYAMFGDAPLSQDSPVTGEALDLALAVFDRCFLTPKVQEKARTAIEKIIGAGIATVQSDGSLSVLASSGKGRQTAYRVTAHAPTVDEDGADGGTAYRVTMSCECRDFWARQHEHGGVCKHVAARLLLFLAQRGVRYLKHLRDALDTRPLPAPPDHGDAQEASAPAADESAGAFLTLRAPDLAAALFLASGHEAPVDLRAAQGALHLAAGTLTLSLPCLDGHGVAAVRLTHETIEALLAQLRPITRGAHGTLALNLFIEPSDASVFLCSVGEESFAAGAQGIAYPEAAPARAETHPTHTSTHCLSERSAA